MFYACSAAWKHLVARGGGSIINTGSISGIAAMPDTPGSIAHATTKGAVIAMTRELALEGGLHNIRANTMLGRIGTSEDIARAALVLASDESSWVTGANFLVDGGFSAK